MPSCSRPGRWRSPSKGHLRPTPFTVRSWAVEGWLGLPKKLETAGSYLPMPTGTDKLLGALSKEGYHYQFRSRLLRVYHRGLN